MGAARRLLERRRAEVVLGGGGYVAGPAGLAAVRMGLPLVLTEADSHLGLANRLLARRARRVCLAFPIPGRDGGPYLVTGRPVPRAVLEADPTVARRRFGIPEPADCVTVVGGSLGARSINFAAFDAFNRLGVPARPRRPALDPPRRRPSRLPGAAPALGRGGPTRALHVARNTSRISATFSPPLTSWSPARAARSWRSRRQAAPRSWFLTRMRRQTIRRPTPAGWPTAERRW